MSVADPRPEHPVPFDKFKKALQIPQGVQSFLLDLSRETISVGEGPRQKVPDSPPPDLGPRYQVEAMLGQGGMGEVYRAQDLRLGRPVAIKVIRAAHASGQPSCAETEARVAAQLDHPNIIKVFDVGECRATGYQAPDHYLSLEYVPGGNLADALANEGNPGPGEACRLVALLAGAMQHAHNRGIAHCDLKPQNVLLALPSDVPGLNTPLGCPKITDFGLARRGHTGYQPALQGHLMGTPSYMAPEQALGQDDVGPAADVYALGTILYRMLTGQAPFRGSSTVDLLCKVCTDPPPPISLANRRIAPGLEALCLECLSKQPERRPAAGQLARRLGLFLEDRPVC